VATLPLPLTLVLAEATDGVLNRASWEAVAAAQQLGAPLTIVVPGLGMQAAAEELAAADATEVVRLEHEALASYAADGMVQALAAFLERTPATHVVLPHTYRTRDFAPRLAARLDRPLITDCTGVKAGETGPLFTRPMFQGKLVADVRAEGPPPHIVTVQAGAFRADAARRGPAPVSVRSESAVVDPAAIRQRPEPPFRESKADADLTQADRIVAVGRGIKGAEHLDLARALAAALGAELAASRPVCDAGWLPMSCQVGSSGQLVAPKLYVALGISGAIQHTVGMRGARTIVAINKDPDAPIFEIADYGVVGDLFEIVPEIVKAVDASGRA
jgi:electron transfer flavoprotein alpha subunit